MGSVCSLEEKYTLEHLVIIRESPKVTKSDTHTHTHFIRANPLSFKIKHRGVSLCLLLKTIFTFVLLHH